LFEGFDFSLQLFVTLLQHTLFFRIILGEVKKVKKVNKMGFKIA